MDTLPPDWKPWDCDNDPTDDIEEQLYMKRNSHGLTEEDQKFIDGLIAEGWEYHDALDCLLDLYPSKADYICTAEDSGEVEPVELYEVLNNAPELKTYPDGLSGVEPELKAPAQRLPPDVTPLGTTSNGKPT